MGVHSFGLARASRPLCFVGRTEIGPCRGPRRRRGHLPWPSWHLLRPRQQKGYLYPLEQSRAQLSSLLTSHGRRRRRSSSSRRDCLLPRAEEPAPHACRRRLPTRRGPRQARRRRHCWYALFLLALPAQPSSIRFVSVGDGSMAIGSVEGICSSR